MLHTLIHVDINMMSVIYILGHAYNFADLQLLVNMEKVYTLILLLAVSTRKLSHMQMGNILGLYKVL